MHEHIRLLDCTLRDGGHLNDGVFGERTIKNVIKNLVDAKVDIIEVGFLWNEACGADTARYHTIEDVKRVLPGDRGVSKFSLMADFIDLDHLEPYDGTVEYIRLSFKRKRLQWGLDTARVLMDKGYKVFINPVNCNVYADEAYIEVIRQVNKLRPYGFSIVDTFGTMRKRDLTRVFSLVDYNLNPDIAVGLHLHENLGLAYSLAQHYIEVSNPKRDVIIDCSLLGMGRVPGNLCTEQIMDHMNLEYDRTYNTEPAFDAIDDYIAPIKRATPWGYSIPYALSARFDVHRSYAEYLLGKRRLKTKDISRILKQIDPGKAELFDKQYIESLYEQYMDVTVDDESARQTIGRMCKDRPVLIIAPGATVSSHADTIKKFIHEKRPIVFSVNFLPEGIQTDCVFCSNAKRIDTITMSRADELIAVTSNLTHAVQEHDLVVSYHDLTHCADVFCDDSTIMLLNLFKKCGVANVTVAGFDGFSEGEFRFYDRTFERGHHETDAGEQIKRILREHFCKDEIVFLTPSAYA